MPSLKRKVIDGVLFQLIIFHCNSKSEFIVIYLRTYHSNLRSYLTFCRRVEITYERMEILRKAKAISADDNIK